MQAQSYVEKPQGAAGAGTVHAEGMFGTITSARRGIQSSARNSGRAGGELHGVATAASGSEYDAYGLGDGEPAASRAGSNTGPPVSGGNMALIVFCLGLAGVMLITLRHKVYKQVLTPRGRGMPVGEHHEVPIRRCFRPLAVSKATLTTHGCGDGAEPNSLTRASGSNTR
jgi:hypothetical protein